MKVFLTDLPAFLYDNTRHFNYGSRFGCSDPVTYDSGIKDHYTIYPWSLGYSSAILRQNPDLKVKAIDGQAEDYNEIDLRNAINNFQPDVLVADLPTIGFSLMMRFLKHVKEDIKCKIVITGLHGSGVPTEIMTENPFIDYILTGEYELALPDLLRSDEEGLGFKKVQGLYFRNNGGIQKTFPPSFNVPFDSLPYPDRDELPVRNYHNFEVAGKPTVQMLTSRGCPFQCSFCNSTVYWPGGAYWTRSIPKVVDEMEFVKDRYKAKQIWFDDDITYVKHDRIRSLAREIMSRKLDLPWAFMGNVLLDEESLALVAKAGAVGVAFGVESANPEVLKKIHKSWVSKERTMKFVKACKKLGLWTHGDFMVGLPYETRESILDTLDFAVELDLDSTQYYAAQPLPGTPMFNQAKENGWLVPDYMEHYDGNYETPLNYPWLSKTEIEELMMECKRTVEKAQLRSFMKSPRRMWKYVKGRGLSYALRKAKTIMFSKDHVYVAGT